MCCGHICQIFVTNKTEFLLGGDYIAAEKYYGIWNLYAKEFQFGICEPSKKKAWKRLWNKIGYDSYKWRFSIRVIPPNMVGSVCNRIRR